MEPLQQEPLALTETDREALAKVDVLMMLRLRDFLKDQLMEYSTAVHASQEIRSDHVTEGKSFQCATQDLEDDIEIVKISFQNKTLALQRMQLMAALRNKLRQNDDDSRLIMETMKQIVMLSKAIIEHQQQTREKEEKLIDVKRKRLSLKLTATEKLHEIHTTSKKKEEEKTSMKEIEMLKELQNNLKRESNVTTIIQNVFQNIILGSRVNWAENPSLKEVVLKLEKDVYFL